MVYFIILVHQTFKADTFFFLLFFFPSDEGAGDSLQGGDSF